MTANKHMSHLDYLQSSSQMLGRLPLFTFLVLPPPPPPGSMLDETKLFLCVIVVSCPNIERGGGGRGAGGIQEKNK